MAKTKKEYNEYHRVYQLARYHRRRQEVIDRLGGKCATCGDTDKLELDHINFKDKKYDVGKMGTWSEDIYQDEMQKCQILCQACHIEKSIQERNYNSRKDHGTSACYRHGGCRCDLCRDACRQKNQEYKGRYTRHTCCICKKRTTGWSEINNKFYCVNHSNQASIS